MVPKNRHKKVVKHDKKISVVKERDTRKPFCYITKTGKTFRERDLAKFALKQESSQIKDKFSKSYGTQGLVEPLYNPEVLANLLEINTYHARCCAVKATDTAGLGYDLQALVDKPNESLMGEVKNFFETQTPPITIILSRMQKDYEAIGYSALEMARVGNVPTGLPSKVFHMPAHTIRVHKDGKRFVQKRSGQTKWFKIINYDKDVNCNTGVESELGTLDVKDRAHEIIWNTDYSSRSDYYGVTCAAPAIGAIYGDLSRRDYNIAFFSNFGIPAYAIFITGDFDPGTEGADGRTDLERTIESHFAEIAKNPHSTLVLTVPSAKSGGEVKIEIQPLAIDIKEASFRLYRKDNRDEVIVAHGVPPYRIGITETGSLGGSIAREATEIYKRSIIEPRQIVLEQIINQEIIWHENGFNTKDFKYKFIDLDTKDEAHEKEMINFLFTRGAITIRGIIKHYAAAYGLTDEKESDDPMLDVRFVDGRPITGEFTYTAEIKSTLKNLQNKLIALAIKDAASGNGSKEKTIELINALNKIQKAD